MSTKCFEIEATVLVECEGKYLSGTSACFSHSFGNFLPGDPEEVSNFRVYINVHGNRIDITHSITGREREHLMAAFVSSCREAESA